MINYGNWTASHLDADCKMYSTVILSRFMAWI